MSELLMAMLPELILCGMACALFLLGTCDKPWSRRRAAQLALVTLLGVMVWQFMQLSATPYSDTQQTVHISSLSQYIKLMASGVSVLLVLLAMPTNADATGGSAMETGGETAEFFGLMLLSLAGVFLVASANDIILLFLGVELASIPTYIMVSISRPLAVAQEAGVKYFFLGAMSAALMLFGFSYLYGTTGSLRLDEIARHFAGGHPSTWQLLAAVMVLAGFAFKIAAVPLHVYAGDVYQGAATPVTAFLAFVPKTSGMVALIKLLYTLGGNSWFVPHPIAKLLWIVAVLTMSFGNVLGLLQLNVKRVLAYSSVAHSGYMLVGLTALVTTPFIPFQNEALQGVLFYLTAYGIMNAGAFGVLMLLPSRSSRPATSAETFEDLAGQGRTHVGLGLAMAVCCFSLIGIPVTIGFIGKLYLIRPALDAELYWLVVITMINAAISAGYYLRIVGTMFLRPRPQLQGVHIAAGTETDTDGPSLPLAVPVVAAVLLSVLGTLAFGTILKCTDGLTTLTAQATDVDIPPPPATASLHP